jgi:hypothetical protein
MPYDDPDPDDPSLLIGVELPADEDTDLEMAYAFAEEFAKLGFSEQQLWLLFQSPFYAGAYRALRNLGEDKIRSVIQETLEVWGRFRFAIEDRPEENQIDVFLESLQHGKPPLPPEK